MYVGYYYVQVMNSAMTSCSFVVSPLPGFGLVLEAWPTRGFCDGLGEVLMLADEADEVNDGWCYATDGKAWN